MVIFAKSIEQAIGEWYNIVRFSRKGASLRCILRSTLWVSDTVDELLKRMLTKSQPTMFSRFCPRH
nr:MAG TPA: hypothetical protein [Bacteriophage sp.]